MATGLSMKYCEYLMYKDKIYKHLIKLIPGFDVASLVDVIATFPIQDMDTLLKNCTLDVIKKLLITKNQLTNLDAHPIGLETSINFNCKNAQNILNVKHLNETTSENRYLKKFTNVNVTIIPNNSDNPWFRIRTEPGKMNDVINDLKSIGVMSFDQLSDTVLEFYNKIASIDEVESYKTISLNLNRNNNVNEIIFYSNCKLVDEHEDKTFNYGFSNLFKFFYCYLTQLIDVEYHLEYQQRIFDLWILCKILIGQKNFNTNKANYLQPISSLSGEKSIPNIKGQKKSVYLTGGPRDGLFLGLGTSLGGNSKAEIEIDLKL